MDRKGKNALLTDFITSEEPFYFNVKLPEGNYQVTVHLGDEQGMSVNTVKAESRRLMLKEVKTPVGEIGTYTFTVNIRTPKINSTDSIRLKTREKPYLNWVTN